MLKKKILSLCACGKRRGPFIGLGWGRAIPSKVNEENAVSSHFEELLQDAVTAENGFVPPKPFFPLSNDGGQYAE